MCFDRKSIAQALRSIYRAETAQAGLTVLDAAEGDHWSKRHPAIGRAGGGEAAQMREFGRAFEPSGQIGERVAERTQRQEIGWRGP